MVKAFGKSGNLNVKDFLTGGLHILLPGNKRMGIDLALQFKVTRSDRLTIDLMGPGISLCIDKGCILTTLHTQFFHIHLTRLNLWLDREPGTLNEQTAILIDHRIAAIDRILRRFAKTTAGIYISADGSGTLLGQQ